MPKILVISDTHGNPDLIREVVKNEAQCEYLIHLGDYYDDTKFLSVSEKKFLIIKVPGIYHQDYYSNRIQFYQKIVFFDLKIICLHALKDLKRVGKEFDIVLFGHTHKQEIYIENNIVYVNPGHLKNESDRGFPASYCILDIEKDSCLIYLKNYRCNLLRKISLKKVKKVWRINDNRAD